MSIYDSYSDIPAPITEKIKTLAEKEKLSDLDIPIWFKDAISKFE